MIDWQKICEGDVIMQEKMCESCGMPMGSTDEMYGTEKSGAKSVDYCKYCYDNGAFTDPNATLESMIEIVAAMMVKDFGFAPDDAKKQCLEGLPNLKRWRASA